MTLKRYEIHHRGGWDGCDFGMEEDDSGKYILHSDHLEAVRKAKVEALKHLQQSLETQAFDGEAFQDIHFNVVMRMFEDHLKQLNPPPAGESEKGDGN